ncbi:HD domain-containing protein [Virgibacillus proomii]|uniref:HD domain-containing protein n=1 Tax=Virgibacillus proomii TaxID=84407 RepID=UPI001C10BF6E|nr:HD domain-containing protein [Virgibacillus proomii]MBU5265469.1 HD domain-containing protein [Virgibacillus proomii]
MLQKAKEFATMAHRGQRRKTSNLPYITHPIRVAKILEEAGCSVEVICAGFLHDVVEDTCNTIKDIEAHFGEHIASIVQAHTEDKSLTWQERKQHTISLVKSANKEIKQLIVADKLDNLLSIEEDLNTYGNVVWDNFSAPFEKQKWYYQSIADVMYHDLSANEIPAYFKTYEKAVARVFGNTN